MGLFVTIYGLVFGSFFNVVALRGIEKKSLGGRSNCTSCNHTLKVLDLIPVISYICLRGKCRYCKAKISDIYPIFELVTALIFTINYIVYGMSIEFAVNILVYSILIINSVSDIKRLEIVPYTVYSGIITMVIYNFCTVKYNVLIMALIAYVIFYLASKTKKMGEGDSLIIALITLLSGYNALYIIAISSISSIIYYVIARKKRDSKIPYVPFLLIGTLLNTLLVYNNVYLFK